MSVVGLFLKRYWKELAALALMAFAVWRGYGWAYDNGAHDCQRANLIQEKKDLAEARAQAAQADARLAAALKKKPQTGKKVNDAVTANPTDPKCVVPDDVIAGMQDGIDAGKAATR